MESGIQPLAPKSDVDALKKEIADLGKRLDFVPAAASPQDLTALANRVARLEAQPVASGNAGETTATAATTAATNALAGRIDDADTRLTALGQRVDALDAKIAGLAGTSASQVEERRGGAGDRRRGAEAGGGRRSTVRGRSRPRRGARHRR